jgi:hypothetical protein
MEYIDGTTLAEELQERKQLPPSEVIDIGLAIADALSTLKAAGIVHRDVKPSNVMIDRGRVVKLTDFGIAKITGFDAVTLTGQLPLSIAYAAPEVWEGRAEHRSDLYAMGVVLYQCLTGRLPFRGAYAEMFYQHRSGAVDLSLLPPETPASLAYLLQACLAKSPSERPADAAACIELLDDARQELGTAGSARQAPAQEPRRFGPWLRQEPVAERPWTWRVRHEQSGRAAVVEVHGAGVIEYGEALRRTVDASEALAPLGGQRALQSGRLLLRPGEAWQEAPPGHFQFWVALEEPDLPPRPDRLTPRQALRAAESLMALIDAAAEEDVPLDLAPEELAMLADGGIFVRHAGFPRPGSDDPETQAIAYLKSLPAVREVRTALGSVATLDEAQRALATMSRRLPLNVESAEPSWDDETAVPTSSQPRSLSYWLALTGLAVAFGVAAAIVFVLLQEGAAPAQPPAVIATVPPSPPPPDPAFGACMQLQLPAPLTAAEGVCGNGVATFAFDAACPRGTACERRESAGAINLAFNDRAIAFIDSTGNLAVAREDGSEPAAITSNGRALQPAWSSDGRYLAYLELVPVEAAPAPAPAPQPGAQFVTQLHVVEADRPANNGVVFSSGAVPSLPPWLQAFASWPQWAPDGSSLYFNLAPLNGAGGQIYAVELPRRGDNLDFARLRSAAPPDEPLLPSTRLATLSMSARDFGQPQGYLGRFSVRPSGEVVVQVCDGERARPSCGLGRWDGRLSRLVATERDRVVEPPVEGAEAAYAYVSDLSNNARLLRIADGAVVPANARPPAPVRPADGAWFAWRPQIAVSRKGDSLLGQTAAGHMGFVSLEDGGTEAWREGHSPVWFRAEVKRPNQAPQPPAVPFQTPTLEPNPTVTPLPTQRPQVRTMTLNLTARRNGNPVGGATVVAIAGAQECQRGTTDGQGRVTLVYPREGAAAACAVANTQVRFQVNGALVPEQTQYDPLSVKVYDLSVP